MANKPLSMEERAKRNEQLLEAVRKMVDETDSVKELATKIVKTIVISFPENKLGELYASIHDPDDGTDFAIDEVTDAAVALEDWYYGTDEVRAKLPSKSQLLKKLFNALQESQRNFINPQLYNFVQNNFRVPGTALDLGCGDGTDIKALRKLGWTCDGVDIRTGTDLNHVYASKNAPYDLVFSNYVLQKLKNPVALVKTIDKNLKQGGRFFLHTFDKTDAYTEHPFAAKELEQLITDNSDLKVRDIRTLHVFDDAPGHYHYHEILQVVGLK